LSHSAQGGGSLLLALLLLSACPSPNRSVDNSNATGVDDAGTEISKEAPALGKYQCRWRHAGKDENVPCEIRVDEGKKTLMMIVGSASLRGSTTPTDYGFQFSGTWRQKRAGSEQPVEAEFLNQGPGAFAAVLTMADKSLAKLDLNAN
jgi:hypothetical protein